MIHKTSSLLNIMETPDGLCELIFDEVKKVIFLKIYVIIS